LFLQGGEVELAITRYFFICRLAFEFDHDGGAVWTGNVAVVGIYSVESVILHCACVFAKLHTLGTLSIGEFHGNGGAGCE